MMSYKHYEGIEDAYFFKIPSRLQEYIPQFKPISASNEIYLMLSEVGNYILREIDNEDILAQCCAFINEAVESGGEETENAIRIELYETFFINLQDWRKIWKWLAKPTQTDMVNHYLEYIAALGMPYHACPL